MNLTGHRDTVAGLLDGLDPDWTVLAVPTDAVDPPAFVLSWSGSPDWLVSETACFVRAQLDVIVVANRLELEGTYPVVEQMAGAAYVALAGAHVPIVATVAPGPLEIAQVTYLAARIVTASPISTEG